MVLRCYLWGVALCFAAFLTGASTTPSTTYPSCNPLNPEDADLVLVANGYCDEAYNNPDCGYDGGDCCPCTCTSEEQHDEGLVFECGAGGYNCLDPAAPCFDETAVSIRLLQSSDSESNSYSPTWAPTSAPTSFFDQIDGAAIASAASGLTGAAIGGIVAVCIVLAIIAAIFFLYKKRQSGGGPQYSAADSTSMT